jgi:SnoaL-like domain
MCARWSARHPTASSWPELSLPRPTVVTVTCDEAVAVCESLVLLRREKPTPGTTFGHVAWHTSPTEYVVWRATANHFELARVDGTWRITARTSRMLNGDPSAHALLSAGLAGEPIGSH